MADAKTRMTQAVNAANADLTTVRTERVNISLFQRIRVPYYGTPVDLMQLAAFQLSDATTLIVTPYDRTTLSAIEKTITVAPNLDATITNNGETIRVHLPDLTQTRRQTLVKVVRDKTEHGKISLRDIRRTAKDDLKALGGTISDDEISRAMKDLETITKHHIDQLETLLEAKTVDLLTM